MTKTQLRRLLLMTVFCMTPLLSNSAQAGAYVGLNLGGWKAILSQTGYGYRSSQSSDPTLGFQFSLGFTARAIFIEYTPQYYLPYIGSREAGQQEANDIKYWSWFSGNIGWQPPFVPVCIYVGGGSANMAYSFGTEAEFHGVFWRVGAGVTLGTAPEALQIRAEYQKLYLSGDASGSVPTGVTTRADLFFVGLGFFFGAK